MSDRVGWYVSVAIVVASMVLGGSYWRGQTRRAQWSFAAACIHESITWAEDDTRMAQPDLDRCLRAAGLKEDD